ncbi:MAG TPA: dicarboxylate/amino acid:cation symporter [Alphaproteobacteria bacterium]|nr:dicarboxylate/amino acid:cation symporter [Alphaproteobacteria bacterium]
MQNRQTVYIVVALVVGGLVGGACHIGIGDAATRADLADYSTIVTDIFLRLVKMLIAPLVFATLVTGLARMGQTKAIGRIGLRSMVWFIGASIVSLLLGLFMVNLLQPGTGLTLSLPDPSVSSAVHGSELNLREFVTHLVPRSVVEAMAGNEILQIVVFSLFFGTAVAALGAKAKPVADFAEAAAHVMLEMTGYVMRAAPLAVFAAVAAVVAVQGLGILEIYGVFVGGFLASLLLLWVILFAACFLVIGPRAGSLFRGIRVPLLLAFSTASSEAAYPQTLERLERFGASNRVISLVLPLGYSFNLDGSTMYCAFATMFIAQAYGIPLSWEQQLSMLLVLMVTSKGMAGVPRGSLVVIAVTLPMFHIPEAGLVLILGVDHFLDMGRSATNVVGNSIAAVVVAKWEGELAASADPQKI